MNDTTTDQRARRAALMLANVQRELYPLARRCGVKAYAAMAKGALVDAILAADPDGALAAAMVPDDGAPADSDDAAGAIRRKRNTNAPRRKIDEQAYGVQGRGPDAEDFEGADR